MTDVNPESARADEDLDAADPASVSPGRRGAPRWVVWAMIVLATVVGIFSSLNAWVEQQVLETENWVEITDELLEDEDIREALSQYIADELFEGIDLAAQIDSQLPDALDGLGAFVAPLIRSGAPEAIDRVLATDAAAGLWRQVNETAHSVFVTVARGDESVIQSTNGEVVLDLGEFVRLLGIDLGLEERLGDRLPDDAGQLVLFETDVIDQVQSAVQLIELTSVILFVVVVGLYVAAVWLARDWRRQALRGVGIAITIAGILVLLLRSFAVNYAVDQVSSEPTVSNAVRAVGLIATDLLDEIAWTIVVVGLLIFAYALLIGPSRAASAVRRWLRPVAANPIVYWAIAALVMLVYVLGAPVAPRQWLSIVVVVALWIGGVFLLRQVIVGELSHDHDDGGDSGAPRSPNEPEGALSAGCRYPRCSAGSLPWGPQASAISASTRRPKNATPTFGSRNGPRATSPGR